MRCLTPVLLLTLTVAVGLGMACGTTPNGSNAVSTPPAMDGGSSDGALLAAEADSALPPLESVAPALIPPDQRRDATSSPIVFDPLRGGVWTANGDVGSISYVDVDGRALAQEVAIGQDVRSVALSPDARWVAAVDRGAGTVTLLDAESRVVRRTLFVGRNGRRPGRC